MLPNKHIEGKTALLDTMLDTVMAMDFDSIQEAANKQVEEQKKAKPKVDKLSKEQLLESFREPIVEAMHVPFHC